MRSAIAGCAFAAMCLLAPGSPRRPEARPLHPPGLLPVLMQTLQQQDERYHVRADTSTAAGSVYVASNPAHHFEARFDGTGVALHLAEEPPLRMRLASARVDAEPAERVVHAPWTIRDGRIEQAGATSSLQVTEWYLNAPMGLEQGFTIRPRADRPGAAQRTPATLALAIDVGGAWTPHLDGDGQAIGLEGPGGAQLRYRGLSAWDAGGRSLPARLAVDAGTITVTVETAGAQYPITIDPFIQQVQLFGFSRRRSKFGVINPERFGLSVAVSGDTAIVGAPFEVIDECGCPYFTVGRGYVFTRSGTTWTLQTTLWTQDSFAMGYSVALEGDLAVLGARSTHGLCANCSGAGAAFIFTRSGTSWSQPVRIAASDRGGSDQFGEAVAVSGDTIIVGANLNDVGAAADQGSAYVFVRAGSTWIEQAQLLASNGAAGDFFGAAVAVKGNTAIIGAPGDDLGAKADQGSVYVFTRSGTIWREQAQLTAADGAASDAFGTRVALRDGLAVVGAPGDDTVGTLNHGAAFIFAQNGLSWSEAAKLVANDRAAEDSFGASVALSDERIVVGATRGNTNRGAAYVFGRQDGFLQQQRLVALDGATADFFGASVSVSGGTILVGADLDDVGGTPDRGSAYVFEFGHDSSPAPPAPPAPPPPALTEIIPNYGSTAGGTLVTLQGSDFNRERTEQVTFDGIPIASLAVVNSSTITGVAPAHTAGSVNVTVHHRDGLTSTLPGGFTYVTPPPSPPPLPPLPPPPSTTTLTVTLGGSGIGRVVSAPAGIACGSDCSETYTAAPVVQLVAIPAADAGFAGWIGDADCSDGSVTMTANRACTARFERLPDGRTLDLNGDGRGDILGYGPAAASSSGAITTLPFAGVLRAGEVNGDRRSDVFAYDPVTGAWSIEANGATALSGAAAPRQSPLVFDVNGDTLADVVFHDPATGQVQPCIPTPSGLDCRAAATVPLSAALVPLDLNGDGRGDLLAYRWATGDSSFLLGAMDGSFAATSHTLAAPANQHLVVFDINADRRSDLLLADPVSGAATVYLNTGGGFTPTGLGASTAGFTLRAATLDGDRRGDLLAYNSATGQTLQALNSGGGFTITASTLPAARDVAVSDLNGDGRSDLVLYDPATGALTFAVSQANGSFTQQHHQVAAGLTLLAQTVP